MDLLRSTLSCFLTNISVMFLVSLVVFVVSSLPLSCFLNHHQMVAEGPAASCDRTDVTL